MKTISAALAAFAVATGLAFGGTAEARQLEPIYVVNSSGYTITHLFVRLDGMNWSRNWLKYTIRPSQERTMPFSPGGKSCTGKIWFRTLQGAEFSEDVDFCYEMTIVLTNQGLDIQY